MFKKLVISLCGALLATLAALTAASAGSTVTWSATLAENLGGRIQSPFVCPLGEACGSGEVVGLGQAQDVVVFGGACAGGCDVRTLTFADGSRLVLDEIATGPFVPGHSYLAPQNSFGHPARFALADVIDPAASTDRFAGATGTATGGVVFSGGVAIITLSGNLTFA